MKKKCRYMPFGYCIKNGVFTIHEEEAALVRQIFEHCLQGMTTRAIAQELNAQPIRYRENAKAWEPYVVLRILKKPEYCGNEKFPALVPTGVFQKAAAICQANSRCTNPDLKVIRKVAACPKCGARLYRSSKRPATALWKCRECGTTCGPLTDADFIGAVINAMNRAIARVEDIQPPNDPDNRISLQVSRLSHQISRELERPQAEPEKLLPLILECAAETYAVCSVGDHDPATMQVKAALTGHPPLTAFDSDLFRAVIKAVVMQPDGTIRLRCRNGQLLE